MKFKVLFFPALFLTFFCSISFAGSKILATSAATSIEGSAGGGIVPWAVISGYGDTGEIGGNFSLTTVNVNDFSLDVASFNIGFGNRLELSYSHHDLHVEPLNLNIRQDIYGLKYKLVGDLIYTKIPQISAGIQYKHNKDSLIPDLLGANDNSGTDYYLSASKLWLAGLFGRNILANTTLRYTAANQIGLLGFGEDGSDDYQLVGEASIGIFLNRHWLIGAEYRQKPDRLNAVNEDNWKDIFIGWFPNKTVSFVLAYSDLGDIAGLPDQSGLYLSMQLGL
jgi:hypothetical protein